MLCVDDVSRFVDYIYLCWNVISIKAFLHIDFFKHQSVHVNRIEHTRHNPCGNCLDCEIDAFTKTISHLTSKLYGSCSSMYVYKFQSVYHTFCTWLSLLLSSSYAILIDCQSCITCNFGVCKQNFLPHSSTKQYTERTEPKIYSLF